MGSAGVTILINGSMIIETVAIICDDYFDIILIVPVFYLSPKLGLEMPPKKPTHRIWGFGGVESGCVGASVSETQGCWEPLKRWIYCAPKG